MLWNEPSQVAVDRFFRAGVGLVSNLGIPLNFNQWCIALVWLYEEEITNSLSTALCNPCG